MTDEGTITNNAARSENSIKYNKAPRLGRVNDKLINNEVAEEWRVPEHKVISKNNIMSRVVQILRTFFTFRTKTCNPDVPQYKAAFRTKMKKSHQNIRHINNLEESVRHDKSRGYIRNRDKEKIPHYLINMITEAFLCEDTTIQWFSQTTLAKQKRKKLEMLFIPTQDDMVTITENEDFINFPDNEEGNLLENGLTTVVTPLMNKC